MLTIAAVAEVATGLALLIAPSFVAQALLGEGLDGSDLKIAHVAGIALVALGIACWPGPPLLGMAARSRSTLPISALPAPRAASPCGLR